MFTTKDKFGLVATWSHMNKPSASWYGMFFILFASWALSRQLLHKRVIPGESGVDVGTYPPMLKHLIICLQ